MNCVDKVAMKITKLSWLHIPGLAVMPRIDFVAVVGPFGFLLKLSLAALIYLGKSILFLTAIAMCAWP